MASGCSPQPNKPPIVHFNYDDLDENCHCALCSEYRSTVAHYIQRRRDTRKHSAECDCFMCVSKQAAILEMRVASNKRDIYSELSYLTSAHRLGAEFLRWVYARMTDESFRGPEWWANDSMRLSLRAWMDEWHRHRLPQEVWAVSGLY